MLTLEDLTPETTASEGGFEAGWCGWPRVPTGRPSGYGRGRWNRVWLAHYDEAVGARARYEAIRREKR